MRMILAVEKEVKGNSYYIALKEAFPNLVATNTPQGAIDWVYRSFSEDVLLILDEDFFRQAKRSNPLFEETLRGLARNNQIELRIILFHQEGKYVVAYNMERTTLSTTQSIVDCLRDFGVF